ncbi:O-methyltransferase [Oerskovia jenensis]|uniref:Uncharacterized protein n=1 Tax=Oerskovia jenensis TaxID=162169 RepID=A0ABS2LFT9_9CELL|nr:O-methyltransferase [Oerskovia jenensis]MBM7479289.1 hypothetical protein [Oerskovia jenensis]
MSSSNRIDYSVRQNKAIERSIVFDGLRAVVGVVPEVATSVYVGFGSVWFTDFHMAHRSLGILRMVSIEGDAITAHRAEFNRPYRTIEVVEGISSDVIPDLLSRPELGTIPWISWLDYDQALDEERIRELDDLVRYLPNNSFLIATFSATGGRYGKPAQRSEFLSGLLNYGIPLDLDLAVVRDERNLAREIGRLLQDRLVSVSVDAGREVAIPCFRLCYKDGTPMVTVGVFLPDGGSASGVRELVGGVNWFGINDEPITTPPLTAREVSALRALLPAVAPLSRSDVQACGFDLEDDQLEAFVVHYNRYPTFAQLAF